MRTRIPHIVLLAFALVGARYGLVHAANVNWLAGNGGTWTDTSNWTSNPVLPGAGDTAIIDNISPGNINVNITAPVPNLGALKLAETINLSGAGTLSVLGTTELPNGGRINAAGAGVQFTGAGVATLRGASLNASQGGKIILDQDNIISHIDPAFTAQARVTADGVDSLIDLSGTKTIAGSGLQQSSYTFEAVNGGTVDLTALKNVTGGTVNFESTGPGSALLIPALTSADKTNFAARAGGQLVAPITTYSNATEDPSRPRQFLAEGAKSSLSLPALTELTGSNASNSVVEFRANGGGLIQAPAATKLNDGSFRFAADHGTVSFPALTEITKGRSFFEATGADSKLEIGALKTANSASWTAREGAQISAPLITSYTHSTEENNKLANIQAHGLNGKVDLSGITQMTSTKTQNSQVIVEGLKRGRVDLSHVASLQSGRFTFTADDGEIDLSALKTTADGKVSFEAKGTDAALKLPALQSVFETSFFATDGGQLLLPALTQFDRDLVTTNVQAQFNATGAGSLVQAPAITQLTSSDLQSSELGIRANSGGKTELSQLTALGSGRFAVIAERGTIALPQLQTIATGALDGVTRIEAIGAPAEIDAPKLSSIRGTSLAARLGGQLELPGLTTLTQNQDPTVTNRPVKLEAENAASRLHLPALTTLTGTMTQSSQISIQARLGGHIDLDGLKTFGGGVVDVTADGAASAINFPALTTVPAGKTRFAATGGGSHLGLDELQSVTNTSFEATLGGEISLPKLSTFSNDGATNNQSISLYADGPGSRVSAPTITALTPVLSNAKIQVRATTGGQVALPAVTTINNGLYLIEAIGAGSKVDLSSLTSATHAGTTNQEVSPITVQNDGLLELGTGTTNLQHVNVTLSGGGRINGGTINLTGRSSLVADGLVDANLSVEGPTRIGGENIGLLDVSGSFALSGEKAEMIVQIGGDTPGASHDAIHIGGAANISGKLTIQLAREFQPVLGQTFEVLTSSDLTGEFAKGGILAGDVFLTPSVVGDNIVVVAALIGDADLSGAVNLTDFGILKAGFGQPGGGLALGDVNASGGTDLNDFGLLKANFGKTGGPKAGALASPVPEPGAVCLALAGLLSLLACRVRRGRRS